MAAQPTEQLQLAAGERAFQKCYSCHSFDPPPSKLSGPTLHRIAGRPIAAEPGFNYSPALRRFATSNARWTTHLLDRFAADPEALVPGTNMTFHGISDPAERRALIRYIERTGEAPGGG